MEAFFLKKCRTIKEEELKDSNSKGIFSPKKKRIKAYEIKVKTFFSDDEDDEYNLKIKKSSMISRFNNQRKINVKHINKFNQNSILIYKEQLQKKSTIDQTPSKKSEGLKFSEDKIFKVKKNINNKKVSFPKDNFITYINVESYKKYNWDNSNKDPYSAEKVKDESKCCLIY